MTREAEREDLQVTLQTFGPHEVGKKGHVDWPTYKHVENSLHGTHHFKRTGCKTTDYDILPDEVLTRRALDSRPMTPNEIAGHIPNTHWPEPLKRDGFRDPKHILHRDDKVSEMVPMEWERLKAGPTLTNPWIYHIPPIEAQLALCGRIGMQALLEPKHIDPGAHVWLRHDVWEYLAAQAAAHHCRTAVYSLFHECLPYARHAGFEAWAI